MFTFLLKLRHPDNARDYARNVAMLELTLESLLSQQTQHPFEILLVCNRAPELRIQDSRLRFLVVDFPASGQGKASRQGALDCWRDKGAKVAAGLLRLRERPPERVFIMDADDWVDTRLVEHVMSRPDVHFWHADAGYLVDFANGTRTRKRGLVRYCGSTLVFDYPRLMAALGIPESLVATSSLAELESGIEEFKRIFLLGHHRYFLGFLHKIGGVSEVLPFRSVCWVTNTGENRSGAHDHGSGIAFDAAFLQAFGLSSLPVTDTGPLLSQKLRECRQMLLSTAGWLFTDKQAPKV